MAEESSFDLAVIGGGPGGYVAAIRASQLGLKTALVEKDTLGGICVNWGCIPSKSLIHQAEQFSSIEHLSKMGITIDTEHFNYEQVYQTSRNAAARLSKGVEYLMKKNGITVFHGTAEFVDAFHLSVDGTTKVAASHFLVATGSSPRPLSGFDFDEKRILSSAGVLGMRTLPGRVAILGGGAVGVEFAHILSSFGVAVYLVEMLDQILPSEDHETVAVLARAFKRSGITIFTSARAASYEQNGDELLVSLESQNAGAQIAVDRIIVSVGRKPNSSGLGLEKIGVETEAGFIKTGEYYTTSVPHICAIGDVIKTPQLAHVASAEGELAVEHIAGHATGAAIDYSLVPSAVYCEPQIAGFGVTEKKAMETGLHYAKAVFPYRGAGKAIAVEKPDGMVKIVYHRDTKEILGAHIAGTEATEVIHELLLAKKAGLRPRDIAGAIHAHPSISEAVKECAGIIENKVIHI